MQAGKLSTTRNADQAFLSRRGFQNWKDATRLFRFHERSICHKQAVKKTITLPATTQHIGEMLSHQLAEERKQNRANLLHILRAIRFLARQGLPFRVTSLTNEVDGNFCRLLHLFCDFDAALPTWLKKTGKYTSADMQNELLQVMALRVLRDISGNVHDRPFTVMVDETTDASTQEQVVIVLRWVDDNLDPHEDFIGLHTTASTNASSILAIIKDVLLRMNVSLSNYRGQCYDGAAVMSGCRGGVATQLAQEEPRALYTHCCGHSLNLDCQDTIRY